MFRDHDKDGNGKLSWKEFAGEETENKNERAFKLMDENHDGKISKSVSWSKRNGNLLKLRHSNCFNRETIFSAKLNPHGS